MSWAKLAPKMPAATTAVMAAVVAISELRAGTAARPRPGAKAIQAPIRPATGPPGPTTGLSNGRCARTTGAAAGLGCCPPRDRDHERHGHQRDGGQAAAQEREVDLGTRLRLGQPGRADRH